MEYLLGIDLGSTSIKAVIYDLTGRAVAKAHRPTEVHHPCSDHPDWAVWKPEQVWGGAADSVREAVSAIGDADRIKGVAVTGMGMDGLPIDKAGNWLYPLISWHCPRTMPQQQWWLEHIGADKQFSVGGNPVWAFNTALRLLWMRQHEPAILDKTDKWLLIEDFVNFMLCGERATDFSMASCTLLFDLQRRQYSEEILKLAGIDRRILCDAKPSGTVIGAVHRQAAERTGLAVGTPVVLGGHDFLCGCLPAGAFRPGVVLNVVGTWEMIVAAIDKPILNDTVRDMGWWIDSHVARDQYAAIGTVVAADMLEWFRKVYGFEEAQKAQKEGGVDWDYLIAQAQAAPPGAGGVMFLPHMSGSTIPVVDPKSLGAFIGLRNQTGKGHMLRAIIEGLNYQCLQILMGLEKGLGTRPEKLVGVGGGTSNKLWMRNKADMIGKPIEIPEIDEATPLGAAILAGIGVGLYRDEQDAFGRVYRPGCVYEPDRRLTERYAERFEVFQRIYPALREINGRLTELA